MQRTYGKLDRRRHKISRSVSAPEGAGKRRESQQKPSRNRDFVRLPRSDYEVMVNDLEDARTALESYKQLYGELFRKLAVDPLTGLHTRKGVEGEFRKIHGFLRSHKLLDSHVIVVAFADIDNFGEFNKRYSNHVGDTVLQAVSKTCRENFERSGDIVGRWGGEEILIVSFEELHPSGRRSAEHMRDIAARIENLREAIKNTRLDFPEHGVLSVTVSIGVYISWETIDYLCDDAWSRLEEKIDRADANKRTAKENGKDRVEVSHAVLTT